MQAKAKLATILRRWADRLSPVPAGDCGSGATWINFSADVPAGVAMLRPTITCAPTMHMKGECGGCSDPPTGYFVPAGAAQIVADNRFDSGAGWAYP